MQVNCYNVNDKNSNPNFGKLKITDSVRETIFNKYWHYDISFEEHRLANDILNSIEQSPIHVSIFTERKTKKLVAILTDAYQALLRHPHNDPEIIIKETKFDQLWAYPLGFLKKVQKFMTKMEKQ